VVIAVDAADSIGPSTTDACSPITNGAQVSGKIALVDRGSCTFVTKVKNAQNAGAIAAIVADNQPGVLPQAWEAATQPSLFLPLGSLRRMETQLRVPSPAAPSMSHWRLTPATCRRGQQQSRPIEFSQSCAAGLIDFPLGPDCLSQPADGACTQWGSHALCHPTAGPNLQTVTG